MRFYSIENIELIFHYNVLMEKAYLFSYRIKKKRTIIITFSESGKTCEGILNPFRTSYFPLTSICDVKEFRIQIKKCPMVASDARGDTRMPSERANRTK